MNKEIIEKIEQFKKPRMGLLAEVQEFPEKHRSKKLFGDWSLKDILVHLTAWDLYTIDSVEDFIKELEIYDSPDEGDFNRKAVEEAKGVGWDGVYEDFVESGAILIESYKSISDKLWRSRISKDKFPIDWVKIDIDHYNDHLKEIVKVVESLDS